MKTDSVLALIFFPFLAQAADLRLADGRVYHDATIVSQTPRTVFLKHAAGLTSVSKTLLPRELATLYPVDEAAAQRAEAAALKAATRAREFHQAEAERVARHRAERAAIAAHNSKVAMEEAAIKAARDAEIARLAAEERRVIVHGCDPFFQPVCRPRCYGPSDDFRERVGKNECEYDHLFRNNYRDRHTSRRDCEPRARFPRHEAVRPVLPSPHREHVDLNSHRAVPRSVGLPSARVSFSVGRR